MFQRYTRLKLLTAALLICVGLVLVLVLGPDLWAKRFTQPVSNHTVPVVTRAPLSTISIPQGQDLFQPYLLSIPLNTTVTWRNYDTAPHLITTTRQASNFLNPQSFSFQLSANKQSQFTFTRAGLYHYYDTLASSWNETISRVIAHPGTPHYPLAMDGVIWVQGPISNLDKAVTNPIPAGHDLFAKEFLAIKQSGGVSWHNFDADPHFIGLVSDWPAPVNPQDIGLLRLAGTGDVAGGATSTLLFSQPGLYYYYCRNHDVLDPLTRRAQALPMNSEYPVPMEGFVLVLSN